MWLRTCFIVALSLGPAGVGWAQAPDSWRGLTLDRATIEDAVAALGQPSKVKENQKLRTPVGAWLARSARYTTLEFKKVAGVKRARLYFQEGTLRVVELGLREKINPDSLAQAYGLAFTPRVPKMQLAFSPENYERQAGKLYPKRYPQRYHLIAVSERAYVVAEVWRGQWAMLGADLAGQLGDATSFPGKVRLIQLISTSLRDARGLGALR
jgi:hypothetical protein